MTRWLQRLRHALLFSLLITGAAAWAAPLTLASKNFTEQRILSAITVQYLRAKGFQVEPKTNLATVITRNAMINKQIDMTWEYTGTSLIIFNHINKRMTPQETYDTVKKLDAKLGLVAAAGRHEQHLRLRHAAPACGKEQIRTMSQLVAKVEQVRKTDPKHNWLLGLDLEFAGRSDGLKPMQALYDMPLDRPQSAKWTPAWFTTLSATASSMPGWCTPPTAG